MTYRHSISKGDVYQRVTDSIVAAIEHGASDWNFPWSRQSVIPANAVTGNKYHGVNVVSLWAAASRVTAPICA